jgi:hypothetical protein
MVPAYGIKLVEHPDEFRNLRAKAHTLLQLDHTKEA